MYWRISELDSALRERLAGIPRSCGLGGVESHYFRSSDRPGKILACILVGLLLSGGLGFVLFTLITQEPLPIAGVASVGVLTTLAFSWTFLSLVEAVRIRFSDVRPFLLVTPKVLVRTDYAHGALEAYRLSEATAFQSADTYRGQKQTYAGRRYTFQFPGRTVLLTLKVRTEMERLDEVLARARQGGQAADPGLSLLPATLGQPKPSGLRALSDPLGAFWIVILAFLLLLLLFGIIGADFIRRYLPHH